MKEGDAIEPTPTPGSEPTPGAAVSESMWGDLADSAETPSPARETPAPAQAAPETPAIPAKADASPQTAVAPSSGTPPSTPLAATPTPVSQPAAQPAASAPAPGAPSAGSPTPAPVAGPTPEAQLATYKANREAYVKELSSNRYRITDDVAATLAAEPEKHLPALLAQVHMNAYEDAMREVLRILPALVPQFIQGHSVSQNAEKAFFTAFPGLSGHTKDVAETAALVRSRNPGITTEQLITQVGTIVSTIKGVPLPSATPLPAAPAAVARTPFAPASPGGPAGSPTAPQSNPFSAFADQIRQEDF